MTCTGAFLSSVTAVGSVKVRMSHNVMNKSIPPPDNLPCGCFAPAFRPQRHFSYLPQSIASILPIAASAKQTLLEFDVFFGLNSENLRNFNFKLFTKYRNIKNYISTVKTIISIILLTTERATPDSTSQQTTKIGCDNQSL